jgi:hypothetical protein
MPDTDSRTLGTFLEHAFFGDPPPAPEISLRFFSTDEHPTELLGIEPTSSNAPIQSSHCPMALKLPAGMVPGCGSSGELAIRFGTKASSTC